jgi:hypothetical protein
MRPDAMHEVATDVPKPRLQDVSRVTHEAGGPSFARAQALLGVRPSAALRL